MGRNPATKAAKLFWVEGRVQGVGFRFFVERVAVELGVTGYVCNHRDGRVKVYAIGEENSLERLRQQLETGPPGARVERVREEAAPLKEYKTFTIEWNC